MKITKQVSISYVPYARTFTAMGWLFWAWHFNLKRDINKSLPDGCCAGIRILGFEIQRIEGGKVR